MYGWKFDDEGSSYTHHITYVGMTASVTSIFRWRHSLKNMEPTALLIDPYVYVRLGYINTDLRSVASVGVIHILYPAPYDTLLQDMSYNRLSILSAPPRSVSLCDIMNFTVILIPGSQL